MRMPVIFSGHGSPMVALENNEITQGMHQVGAEVIKKYGKPKDILAISAHWYIGETAIQSASPPQQVYDMYGFPKELYELKYPVKGSQELTNDVLKTLGPEVKVNDDWGIDHGTWSVLVHMFPDASIPVVQLSVNRYFTPRKAYEIGKKLAKLRDEGYLIFASGNVVHNLMRVEWDNPHGSVMTDRFNHYIVEKVTQRDDEAVLNFTTHPDASYAVPTPDHFMPLFYILGATQNEVPQVFNNVANLGSMAMTGFVFGI